jgi:hypothetical protein
MEDHCLVPTKSLDWAQPQFYRRPSHNTRGSGHIPAGGGALPEFAAQYHIQSILQDPLHRVRAVCPQPSCYALLSLGNNSLFRCSRAVWLLNGPHLQPSSDFVQTGHPSVLLQPCTFQSVPVPFWPFQLRPTLRLLRPNQLVRPLMHNLWGIHNEGLLSVPQIKHMTYATMLPSYCSYCSYCLLHTSFRIRLISVFSINTYYVLLYLQLKINMLCLHIAPWSDSVSSILEPT